MQKTFWNAQWLRAAALAATSLLAGPVGAVTLLTYEYDPGPMVNTSIYGFIGTCEEYVPDPSYPFTCGEMLDPGYVKSYGVNPLLSFDTETMPFDIRGKRLLMSSYDFLNSDRFAGLRILDGAGVVVYELETESWDFYDVRNIPWLAGYSYGLPFTLYDITFDENGFVTQWDVSFDNDSSGASYDTNTSFVRRHLDGCGACVFAHYRSDVPGEWLINGVPQSDLMPQVPLPAAGLLYLPLLLAGGAVMARRRR